MGTLDVRFTCRQVSACFCTIDRYSLARETPRTGVSRIAPPASSDKIDASPLLSGLHYCVSARTLRQREPT